MVKHCCPKLGPLCFLPVYLEPYSPWSLSSVIRRPCVSRTCKLTVFVVHWRRVFLISTRHIERITGVFCDDALYKLTFTFTWRPVLHLAISVSMSINRDDRKYGKKWQKSRQIFAKITASIHTPKRDVFISTCIYIVTGIIIQHWKSS